MHQLINKILSLLIILTGLNIAWGNNDHIPFDPTQAEALLRAAGAGFEIKRTAHFVIAYDTDESLLAELVSRLESYVFLTHLEHVENVTLTSQYEVGIPDVITGEDHNGAVLRIACRYIPETIGRGSTYTWVTQVRDLLFLAPDPSPYIAE